MWSTHQGGWQLWQGGRIWSSSWRLLVFFFLQVTPCHHIYLLNHQKAQYLRWSQTVIPGVQISMIWVNVIICMIWAGIYSSLKVIFLTMSQLYVVYIYVIFLSCYYSCVKTARVIKFKFKVQIQIQIQNSNSNSRPLDIFHHLLSCRNSLGDSKGCDNYWIFFVESFVICSFHMGLLMGRDTFSRLHLVNLHRNHLWNIG